MKANYANTIEKQNLVDLFVIPYGVWLIMHGTVDVDGCIDVTVEEIWSCHAAIDEVLGIARRTKHVAVDHVEPAFLQLTVTTNDEAPPSVRLANRRRQPDDIPIGQAQREYRGSKSDRAVGGLAD